MSDAFVAASHQRDMKLRWKEEAEHYMEEAAHYRAALELIAGKAEAQRRAYYNEGNHHIGHPMRGIPTSFANLRAIAQFSIRTWDEKESKDAPPVETACLGSGGEVAGGAALPAYRAPYCDEATDSGHSSSHGLGT